MSELSLKIIGFVTSLLLTLSAYFVIIDPSSFSLSPQSASMVIIALAFVQSLVQLIFFIDVWHEKGGFWNLSVFLSTSAIIFIVVFFSIWIMDHLNYNMMSM